MKLTLTRTLGPCKGLFAAAFLSATLLAGCEEPPEACYTVSATLVDVNAPQTFTNCTEPSSESYEWDFGDGGTSTEVNPVHTFTEEGQYIVSLSTKGNGPNSDDVFKTIIVAGQRVMASATIEGLPATNPSSAPWDAGDDPDVAVRFSLGGVEAFQSNEVTNAPLTAPISVIMPLSELALTPGVWTFDVLDIDGAGEETMASFSFDFQGYVPNADKTVVMTNAGGTFTLVYNLR